MSQKSRAVAQENMIASMGGFGCKYYDVQSATKIEPPSGRYISAVQTLDDTVIDSIEAGWDVPADDFTSVSVPQGTCIYLKAKSITISDGSGIIYYGCGDVA